MRKLSLFFLLFLMQSTVIADEIHPRARNEKPEIYECQDRRFSIGSGAHRKFSITRVGQNFRVAFENNLLPGKLSDYLAPLGVDDRIIANYHSWSLAPFEIPASACQGKTFGSLFAEELTCSASGVQIVITAHYRDSQGKEKEPDQYTIKDSQIVLDTKVRDGLDGTVCFDPENGINSALQLDFKMTFRDSKGRSAKVSSTSAFHPYCEIDYGQGEGGGVKWHGACSLTGLEGLYKIYVSDLIKLRNKK
jgi:hypothetical protein